MFRIMCLVMGLFILNGTVSAQDSFSVSGVGEARVEYAKRKKKRALMVQTAMNEAERNALKDAVHQAVLQVYGDERAMDKGISSRMDALITRGLTVVKSSETVDVHREHDLITVTVAALVSRREIMEMLENEGLSLVRETEGGLRVYVLTYTVEGIDADRSQPIVLRDEVHDVRADIHSESLSYDNTKDTSNYSDQTKASASSNRADLDYHDRALDKGQASYSGKGHVKASNSERVQAEGARKTRAEARVSCESSVDSADADAIASDSVSYKGSYKGDAKLDAGYDEQGQASHVEAKDTVLKASNEEARARYSRGILADSNFTRNQRAESHFSDTSSDYYSLKVYADPTKKGGGQTNEIRSLLEGMFNQYGLDTRTLDVQLLNMDFRNEDELIRTVWRTIEQEHPEVDADSFVAVALNRNTPVLLNSGRYKFTSAVTYRVFRLKDGYQLLPSQSLTGESEEESSEDLARSSAVKLALVRAHNILRKDLIAGLKRYQRMCRRESESVKLSYKIIIRNVSNPMKTRVMEKLLRQGAFKFTRSFRAGTVTLHIELGGKTSDAVLDVITPFVDRNCDFESMDMSQAVMVLR